MIHIPGPIVPIAREKHICPDDGIHRAGPDGCLRGAHGVFMNGKFVPYGLNSFYWQIDEATGVKVYYSIVLKKRSKKHEVKRIFRRMLKIWSRTGINPKPLRVESVLFDGYKGKLLGIVTEHCAYPKADWMNYARGCPYGFVSPDNTHPDHNPAGFLRFRKQAKKVVKKYRLTSKAKLGDVVYDMNKKRWLLVDMD